MSTAKSPLLSLPRELRNIIYQHLDRQTTLKWETSVVDWESVMFASQLEVVHETFDVCFENLPDVNIPRAHSQLHDEYKDENRFRELSVIIDVDFSTRRAKRYNRGEAPDLSLSPHCTARLHGIFFRVRHIKLFVKARQDTIDQLHLAEDSFQLALMIKQIHAAMPNTDTFQVAIHKICCYGADNQLEEVMALLTKNFTRLHIPVTHDLLGKEFPLVQRGHGFRLGHYYRSTSMTPLAGQQTGGLTAVDGKIVNHLLHTAAVHTFHRNEVAKNKDKDRYYWQVGALIEHWAVGEYPTKLFTGLEKAKVEEIARYPFEIQRWTEKRGEESKLAW